MCAGAAAGPGVRVHVPVLMSYAVAAVRRTPMDAPGDDRFFAALGACTAELARIIDGDLDRPVPARPGWTFRQLATHVRPGHRGAAQIVATRATAPVSTRDVADGKLPDDPARHQAWLPR